MSIINIDCFLEDFEPLLDKDGALNLAETKALIEFLELVDLQFSLFSVDEWAYVLATVFHETAHTFKPVKEAFWLSENWRKNNLRYFPYYGRGFVQITWKANYEKFSKLMDVDFVNKPDLALKTVYAFHILILGMRDGLFTGKKLSDYINKYNRNYVGARRIINGTDKAELIANYAEIFRTILLKCS